MDTAIFLSTTGSLHIFWPITAVILGLILLVWSADKFVSGAASVASILGMSPLLIGMVIVGFGTSAPEMCVSVLSAVNNSPDIALGNAYGSNIANVALILGCTALIFPILVTRSVINRELPVLIIVSLLCIPLLLDGNLSRFDGILMIIVFVGIMIFLSVKPNKADSDNSSSEEETEATSKRQTSIVMSVVWLLVGLAILVGSSQILVWGAKDIAHRCGVHELVVGLTVVAVGTSLPELASSIAAAVKKEHDIALGNIIGSNLFNTLMVVGLAATVKPFEYDHEVLVRDFPVMIILTAILFVPAVVTIFTKKTPKIGRIFGFILLTSYIVYTVYLILSAFGKI
jgi:cation:H+ antiporter